MAVGLDAWGIREVQRWVTEVEGREQNAKSLEMHAAQLGEFLDAIKKYGPPASMCQQIVHELFIYASRQRANFHLDHAEWAARLMRAMADRMLRDFPEHPCGHSIMSQVHVEASKNAWKRDDIPTVRASLTASIASLRRALELDPADDGVRSRIVDQSRRLAALPPP
jgi:hypothetical protein